MKKFEAYFDLLYLSSALILGILLLLKEESFYWGLMTLVLAIGDSTHLLPRVYQIITKKRVLSLIGYGKMITSITMTLFYLILWHIGLKLFSVNTSSLFIYTLCAIRIILCILPNNKWANEKPSYAWGIYRNIPFVIQGLLVIVLFFEHRRAIEGLGNMFTAISLSFLFYLPVVLWSNKKPIIGMLMLPKTICYVWIITMGFLL